MSYKILSMDGGGTWALLQVRALQAIYGNDRPGYDVLKDFNLVIANSGGSIVAAGLFANYKLSEILQLFQDAAIRTQIFKHDFNIVYAILEGLAGFGPKYNTEDKLAGLEKALASAGNPPAATQTLAQVAARFKATTKQDIDLVITAFDYDTQRAAYFRSFVSKTSSSSTLLTGTLAQVVNASSTAPVNYFDKPAAIGSSRYWDGGVAGLNNPVLAGVVEALANGVAADQIHILSIGTGTVRIPVEDTTTSDGLTSKPSKAGLIHDVELLASSVLDDPPDASSFQAYVVLGLPLDEPFPFESPRFVRLNPRIGPVKTAAGWEYPPGFIGDDGKKLFSSLKNLKLDAVADSEVASLVKLGDLWTADLVPNQGIRSDQYFQVQLGYDSFKQAVAMWNSVSNMVTARPLALATPVGDKAAVVALPVITSVTVPSISEPKILSIAEKIFLYFLLVAFLGVMLSYMHGTLRSEDITYSKGAELAQGYYKDLSKTPDKASFRPDLAMLYTLQFGRAADGARDKTLAAALGIFIVIIGTLLVLYGVEASYQLSINPNTPSPSSLQTSSPGLVLITLGSAIIIVTLFTHSKLDNQAEWIYAPQGNLAFEHAQSITPPISATSHELPETPSK